MLVSAAEMLKKAKAGHYAVGQFNINNLEWTKAILLTAQEQNSPVILGVSEKFRLERKETLDGILTASGLGAIIMKNATVSGAEGGCQAECGGAAATAAAAAVEMRKGTPRMAVNACSLALINVMGLVCDPVAGLVQMPCAQRNASQAVNALLSADLALGGMVCPVPADEVVEAMYRIGKQLPSELKETALGGLAATPTAKKLEYEIFH